MSEPKSSYRSRMYDRYVSLQAPSWSQPRQVGYSTWETSVLRRLDGWLSPNRASKILDLGCGPGSLLVALRERGYNHTHGVDISPQAVEIARSKGCEVDLCDVGSFLKTSNDKWDIILVMDLVEHFQKDELLELLNLIERRLNDGGSVLIQTPNAVSPWASHLRYGDLTHEIIFTPSSIATTLTMSGFGSISVREVAPVPLSILSVCRWLGWKGIFFLCAIWNLVETGGLIGGIYTRNMLVRAEKGART